MAYIDLVIRISEEDFKIMKHNVAVNNPLCPLPEKEMVTRVANGIPLPKGHGKLIDADELLTVTEYDGKNEKTYVPYDAISNASTIIEADE